MNLNPSGLFDNIRQKTEIDLIDAALNPALEAVIMRPSNAIGLEQQGIFPALESDLSPVGILIPAGNIAPSFSNNSDKSTSTA